MPEVNGKYVAPTWTDGGAPAISATELQAICDAIVRGETDVSSLVTAMAGKGSVQTGSYVGTGTYGADNKNSLTFSFVPKLVAIGAYNPNDKDSFPIVIPYGGGMTMTSNSYYPQYISWSNKTITWYTGNNMRAQLNGQGSIYYYTAIG